jgi:hypothetical protein
MSTNFATVSRGEADSVAGPQNDKGFQDAVVAAEAEVNLSAWAGHYVCIQGFGDDFDVCFNDTAGEAISTGDIAVNTAGQVARRIYRDTDGIHVVVPSKKTILRYKPVTTTTGTFRVTRS